MKGLRTALDAATAWCRAAGQRRSRKKGKASLALVCVGLLPAFFWSTSSLAAVLPEALYAELDQRFDAYANASAFTAVEPDQLTADGWYDSGRFPNHPSSAMSSPDADLHPVTRAILLLESREPALPHTRYRINYRLESASADFPDLQHAYIEVTRFNLGPARHADTVENYGANAAPLAEFGTGPSVVWRFVTGSNMGMRADVLRASRKVLRASDAATADCLGSRCTELSDPTGPSGWTEFSTTTGERKVGYADRQGITPNAARMADDLLAEATADGEESTPPGITGPSITAVISLNVDGQDDMTTGLLLQDHLLDDSVAQIWTRHTAGDESWATSWARTSVGRVRGNHP